MRLTSLSITNYRALRDVTIPLSRFGCLIGENNSGKSAFLPVRGQQVVDEFFSQDKKQRVSVLRDDRGIFRVRSFRWCIEDWEVAGRAFWIQEDAMNTMTDSLENARRLAGEYLAGLK